MRLGDIVWSCEGFINNNNAPNHDYNNVKFLSLPNKKIEEGIKSS